MSAFCDSRCGRRSQGSIGLMRYCRQCFAEMAGWRANDHRLKEVVTIELHDDGRDLGLSQWVPDCVSKEPTRG